MFSPQFIGYLTSVQQQQHAHTHTHMYMHDVCTYYMIHAPACHPQPDCRRSKDTAGDDFFQERQEEDGRRGKGREGEGRGGRFAPADWLTGDGVVGRSTRISHQQQRPVVTHVSISQHRTARTCCSLAEPAKAGTAAGGSLERGREGGEDWRERERERGGRE